MRRPQPDPPRLRRWKCRQTFHVYQRGSQRQHTFHSPTHLLLYLNRLDLLASRYKVRIHAFCFMSNHVHFMLEPLRRGAISRLMQHLQSFHARYINGLSHTQGHLWRNHFHAIPITDKAQYCNTLLYIEQNPVKANIAKSAHLYPYSSAPAHTANDPIYTLTHKKQKAQVRLYLDRWRKEFEVTPETNWAAWHQSPQQATTLADFLQRLAAFLGKPPQPATALPLPHTITLRARGS